MNNYKESKLQSCRPFMKVATIISHGNSVDEAISILSRSCCSLIGNCNLVLLVLTISLKVVRKILALEFVKMSEITVDDVAQTLGRSPTPTRPPMRLLHSKQLDSNFLYSLGESLLLLLGRVSRYQDGRRLTQDIKSGKSGGCSTPKC